MANILLQFFEPLKSVSPVIYTLIISFVPLIELRGSIPVAIAMGLPWYEAYLYSVIGSMIPAFFVIPLFDWALKYLEKHHFLPWLTDFLNKRVAAKAQQVANQTSQIERSDRKQWQKELLKFWAVVVFVAVPLPGTGVYTGSAIASLIKMDFPKALAAVFLGDVIAGAIVTALSLGVFSLL